MNDGPSDPQASSENARNTLFVTIGSTSFDTLIEIVSSSPFQQIIVQNGFTRLVVQYGNGAINPCVGENVAGLDVVSYRFKNNIGEDLKTSNLTIGHAGAGTITEALRMESNLVVVVNTELMDNHQRELAEALQDRKVLRMCTCDGLLELMELMFSSGRSINLESMDSQVSLRHRDFIASCIRGSLMVKDVRVSRGTDLQDVAFCFRDGHAYVLWRSVAGKNVWHPTGLTSTDSLSERMDKSSIVVTLEPGEYIIGCKIGIQNISLTTNKGRTAGWDGKHLGQTANLIADAGHMIVGIEHSTQMGGFSILQDQLPPSKVSDGLSDLNPFVFQEIVNSTIVQQQQDCGVEKTSLEWLELALLVAVLGVLVNLTHSQIACSRGL